MYYEVAPGVAFAVLSRVASTALNETIASVPFKKLTFEEAMTYARRVVVVRDPIERIDSFFHLCYWATAECHSDMRHAIPSGIVNADGYRLLGGIDRNPHHHTPEREAAYLARVDAQRAGRRISDADLAVELDATEYKNYIDYIFSGGSDKHWNSQIDQITDDKGTLFANEFVMLEDLTPWWSANVKKGLSPTRHSYEAIEKPAYRVPELKTLYAKDLERRV